MTTEPRALPKAVGAAPQAQARSLYRSVEYLVRAVDTSEVFFTYVACLLTPVSILVVQDVSYDNALSNTLFLCDLLFLAKFCMLARDRYEESTSSKSKRHKSTSSERHTNYRLLLAFLSFSPLYLVPLTSKPFTSVLRMTSMTSFLQQFETCKSRVEKAGFYVSAIVSRTMLTILGILWYASTMGCVWFWMAYSLERDLAATWIAADPVMQLDSYASRYFRSLHFVVATLATIGYVTHSF